MSMGAPGSVLTMGDPKGDHTNGTPQYSAGVGSGDGVDNAIGEGR